MAVSERGAAEVAAGEAEGAGIVRRSGLQPDFWYPLAQSEDVKPGRAHRATFAGEAIVVARTERGAVFARRMLDEETDRGEGTKDDGRVRLWLSERAGT